MKLIYTTLFLLSITLTNNAQNFTLDTQKGFKYKRLPVLDSLNVEEPDFEKVKLTLRIYFTSFESTGKNSKVIQVLEDKSGFWTEKTYSYYFYNNLNHDFKDVVISSIILKNSWNESWKTIIDNNYLNLPSESDIDFNNREQPILLVADGNSYIIEILTKKKKRRIIYSNPEAKYKVCMDENFLCPEYKNFIQFINLLKNEFDF